MKVVKRQRTAQMAPESGRMLPAHPLQKYIICFCSTLLPIIQCSQHLILENSLPLSPNNVLLRCCNSHAVCLETFSRTPRSNHTTYNYITGLRSRPCLPTSPPGLSNKSFTAAALLKRPLSADTVSATVRDTA